MSWFPLDENDLKERRHKLRLLDVVLDNNSAFTTQSPKLDALLVFVSVPPPKLKKKTPRMFNSVTSWFVFGYPVSFPH